LLYKYIKRASPLDSLLSIETRFPKGFEGERGGSASGFLTLTSPRSGFWVTLEAASNHTQILVSAS
jgi:hypothetical protein